jgi:acyl carrier protein
VPEYTDHELFRPDVMDFLESRGIDPTGVTDGTRLAEDLGLDSLALTEMGFALLSRHGVMLTDDHILGVRTVGDVLDVLGDAYARLSDRPR